MRALHRLSPVKVAGAKRPGYYADGGNLYLRIAPGGTKGWIFRFTLAGKTRDAGLGPYPTVSLAKARTRAAGYRELVEAGVDPIQSGHEERNAARIKSARAMTFEQCARAYITTHDAGWKNDRHRGQWRTTLQSYCYPVFGALPVQSIDTALVYKVLQPMWAEKTDTAVRVRGRIEAILDWAKVRGYREGENPARWRGHLDSLLPAKAKVRRVVHHAALPYRDIAAMMGKVREDTSIQARAMEFLILTATRAGETLGARWDEIDMTQSMWIIPRDRMKGGREHRVPLSKAAMAIVKAMAAVRQGDLLFPGRQGRPLSLGALRAVLQRVGHGQVTSHGFRSSFRDWAAETTSFPREAAEMALAHAVGDRVEAAYRRGDLFPKRRELMEAWAAFCARGPVSAKVVPIRSRTSR